MCIVSFEGWGLCGNGATRDPVETLFLLAMNISMAFCIVFGICILALAVMTIYDERKG